MKKLAVLLGVAIVTVATTFAQGRDLSGTWNFDAAKTGPMQDAAAPKSGSEPAGSRRAGPGGGPGKVVIAQTNKTISITMGRDTLTFNFDGTESDLGHDGKGKVAWKGDKLEVTITNPRGPQTMTFSHQGAWLVMEPPAGQGPKMLYFAKAAPGK